MHEAYGGKLSEPVQEQNPYEAVQAVMQPESGKEIQLPMEKLDELTKKQTAELAKRSVNTEEDDQISLEDVGLDGPNVRRKRRRAIKKFSKWIEHEPKDK